MFSYLKMERTVYLYMKMMKSKEKSNYERKREDSCMRKVLEPEIRGVI